MLPPVWPLPRSLATTSGISVDFSSSPYLDVSVQAVPPHVPMYSVHVDRVLLHRVSPFGNPRIKAHLRLPVAYRSLSRPSSALSAKAFPLRPLQLDQLYNPLSRIVADKLSFISIIRVISVKFSYFVV